MLRENARYPRVLETLLYAFNELKDLNEVEAEEALLTFLAWDEDYILRNLAVLIVYFALFREKNFLSNGSFDNTRFMDVLERQIASGASSMRSSLAWHFWKIIHDKLLPYETIRKSLSLFWKGEYDPGVASMFSSIFEELKELAPEDAIDNFRQMLSALKSEVKVHPERAAVHWVIGTDKIIPVLARDPDMLLSVVKDLQEIWMEGVPVADAKTIFESYRLVSTERKLRINEALRSIFEEMKKIPTTLPAVDWNL